MKQSPFYILFLLSFQVLAQAPDSDFASGLLLEDAAYDMQAQMAPENGIKAELPTSIDLTPYCPEIRHQGYIFSCVGWAAGYGALSIQRAILNECTDKQVITRNAHSALFLYNQIKPEDCDKGSRISDALAFLSNNGDCLARQFDFDVNDCAQLPDSAVRKQAQQFAIEDYLSLFGSKEAEDIKIRRVKLALSKHKPVVIGMLLRRNFYDLKNAKYWHPELGNTISAGGHAMVVVGYDDKKAAFQLMNSWGKNWGDAGYIWVKYDDFARFCKYAYILYLFAPEKMVINEGKDQQSPIEVPNEKPLLELAGDFQFRAHTGWMEQSGQPLFETAKVELTGNTYKLQKKDWKIGQLFQLLVNTVQDNEYLYVFSVDAQDSVHFHWPRQVSLSKKFEGQHQSGLLISGGAITIPGPSKALKISQPGTDRLVLIFSKRKVTTIARLAELLRNKPGDFAQNLLQILGEYAIPPADINYHTDHIGFHAATRSQGYIVPLVLEVQANE